ncbi:MAG: protein-disulfide reductase DsbD domain-containing protein [Phycisphaerales bacterium]
MALGTDVHARKGIGAAILVAGAVALSGAACGGAVRASLVADRSVVTAGETFTVGVVFEIDDGWHTYWRNPGDSGAPPRFTLTLPEGWEWDGMGSVEWPCPERHELPGAIVDYVYHGRVALLARVRVSESARVGMAGEIRAEVEWLECDADRCVPGDAAPALRVMVGETSEEGEGSGFLEAQRLKTARAWEHGEVRAEWEGETLTLRVGESGGGVERMEFFPYVEGETGLMPADDGKREWVSKGGVVRVGFDRDDVRNGGEVRGNLVVERASGEREVWEVRARAGGSN